LDAALEIRSDPDVTVAAGCTDLFPATEARALTGPVLDLTNIAELRGVTRTPSGWRLGAITTWTDVIRSDVPPAFDALKQAAREVGSVQIQNAGTIAGNVCTASPAADGVPCLLALDAEVELAALTGIRRMPLSAFLTGPRSTALRPDEIVVAVHVPETSALGRSCFRKLGARRYLVISIAMVAVRFVTDGPVIREAAIAVGACSATACRLAELEARLVGQPGAGAADQVVGAEIAAALSPIDDIRADAAYRRHAAAELVRRALDDIVPQDIAA